MMFYTHLAFGLLSGIFIMNYVSVGNKYIYLVLVLVGALLPDLDHPDSKFGSKAGILSEIIEKVFGHRGMMHTIYIALILSGLVYYFISHPYGIAIFVGYTSHLLIDGFTKQGINFLHPLSKLHLSGFVQTGSVIEKGTAIFICVLIIAMLI